MELEASTLRIDAWTRSRSEPLLQSSETEWSLHQLAHPAGYPVTLEGPQRERQLIFHGIAGGLIIPHLSCTKAEGTQLCDFLNEAIQEASLRHGEGRGEIPRELLDIASQSNKSTES